MDREKSIAYFIGFADAEGCFNISLKKQESARFGWVLDPVFHITQHKNNISILKNFKKMLGCGRIIQKYGQENTLQFIVDNRKELVNYIIPFFRTNKLIAKREDFDIFSEVVEALDNKKHGNLNFFKKLLKKSFKMNLGGKQRRYNLDNVLKSLGSSETIRQKQNLVLL
jgi:hypothetical protein